MPEDVRALLQTVYHGALAGCAPGRLLAPHLRGPAPDLVLAVGKAARPMLEAALDAYGPVPALCVLPAATPWTHPPPNVEVIHGGHPLPDAHSVRAGRRALARMSALSPHQHALVLVSGGGSALLCAPRGVTLAQKAALTRHLLRSGASIGELNAVRKHLSAVKGGQLAAATRARVRALLLSDVVGDDPATIASGPTVPDPTTFADTLAVLDRFNVRAPAARAVLESGARGKVPETPKALPHADWTVIGSNRALLEAASAALETRGVRAVILGDTFTGEARDLALTHAALVRSVQGHGTPARPPVALLSGGEATVTVRGTGTGGRNSEFALALALALGEPGVWGLSAGSDGLDGTSGAAGAFLTHDTLARARALGLSPTAALAANDSAPFFAALGDALVTGPTGHNLNDLRILFI